MNEELTMLFKQALHDPAPKPVSLETLETATRQYALNLAAQMLESTLNADHSDYVGSFCCCNCGNEARYAGKKSKTVVSVVGEMTLSRAYYLCDHCGAGWFP